MTERIKFIDLAKGMCIMLVVLYHINRRYDMYPELFKILSTFRMPLYFFLSGLFFKEYENFFGFLKRKTNKLLIPFLFFYLITSFLMPNLLYQFGYTVEKTQSLGISGLWAFLNKEQFSNGPIWFLWCLFLLNIIFYLIYIVAQRTTRPLPVLLLLGALLGGLGMACSINGVNLRGFLDTALTALPFFCIGYVFRKHTRILYDNSFDKYLPVIICICAVITIVGGGNSSYKGNHFNMHPLLVYIRGMSGTLFIVFLAKYLKNLPFISYWGRYSIMVLLTHGLLLQVYIPIVKKLHLGDDLSVVLLLIGTMFSYNLVIPLMKKYLPYVTAQKDVIPV